MTKARPRIDFAAWQAAAKERYPNRDAIAFVCPACKHRQTVGECLAAGHVENMIAFSCIGRSLPKHKTIDAFAKGPGPCSYAGGGLFRINPVTVLLPDGASIDVFDFADRPLCEEAGT